MARTKVGRAFNHLEDLIFLHGSEGALEVITHLRDFGTTDGANSIRMKWDGTAQIYWGRDQPGDPLILAGHAGWLRKIKTTSADEIYDFIVNQSGNVKTDLEKSAREHFAHQFSNLYPIFDSATPKDFTGFVYADVLYLNRPKPIDNTFSFYPNTKSNTGYHVLSSSPLGMRIANSSALVVGHGKFESFGQPDDCQLPKDSFSEFNSTSELIVLDPVYNKHRISIDHTAINNIESLVYSHAEQIDSFLASISGLQDLKKILYRYINFSAKNRELSRLSELHFLKWLENSGVTINKQKRISQLIGTYPAALSTMLSLIRKIQEIKDSIIEQIGSLHNEIKETNREGLVRYATHNKKFGHIKLIPRTQWIPS